ncbi:hypothetical protein DQP55_25645, partial [Mycolicibacterium sp. GF69]|uniref:condensation domain-containing protein n=1 Tax=Mycolicibacterium sp. GF69 TaxID=2267251 RepID=UPI000DCE4C35
ITPARLTQRQIDELDQQYELVDVFPLTPLQQGLLFHANAAQARDDLYAVQLTVTLSGALDSDRLREAVDTVIERHPNLAARFCPQFEEPVQIIPARRRTPWRYADLIPDEHIERVCAEERAAVCDLVGQQAFRVALIRTAEQRHRFVLTFHHIVMDGWSLPILLGEILACYHRQRLPAPGSYRNFVTWLAERDRPAAETVWRDVLAGFEIPT